MKKMLGRFIIVLTVVVITLNFCMTPASQAGWLEDLLQSVIGLFTWPIRAVAIGVSMGINALTAALAYIEGATEGNTTSLILTPFDILFNKVKVFDINFFDIATSGVAAKSMVNQIRVGIAAWYYALRNIAAAILLCMLIYVGIRMAITTIATDKAMYKKMLVDWVSSVAILFLLHYIMIFTIAVNNAIINALSSGVNTDVIDKTYQLIRNLALDVFNVNSIAATVVYCMLVWQTLGLVFTYFNRMLKLAFLTIIAPLVTITYSIDKMGDGKAQALGNWLKEYVYTILIQPFHCIVYMTLVDMGFKMIEDTGDADTGKLLAAAVIAILCVRFTKDAEQLVRKIFAFKDDGSTGLNAGLAVAAGGLMAAKNIGRSARQGVNSFRNFKRTGADSMKAMGRGLGKMATGARVMALAGMKKLTEENTGSWADTKSEVRAELNEKKADKIAKKDSGASPEKYNVKEDENFAKQVAELRAANPNMGEREAKSQVRLNNAKAIRRRDKANKNGKNKNPKGNKKVSKARGFINKLKDVKDNSAVVQGIASGAKAYIGLGMGLAVGSGLYGTGKDLATVLTANAAVVKGTKEFMQGSRGTLRKGVKENFAAMGINSQQAALRALPNILALHSNPEEAKKELDSIMKEIENALQEAGIDSKTANTIKNTVQAAVRANPGKTDQAIKYALTGLKAGNESAYTAKDGKVRQATEKLANHLNGAEIYKAFQTAADFGLQPDTFAADVASTFDNIDDGTTEMTAESVVTTSEESKPVTEQQYEDSRLAIDASVDEYTEGELYDLNKAYEDRKLEIEKDLIEAKKEAAKDASKQVDVQKLEEEKRQLEREQVDVIGHALADADREVSETLKKIEKEYEEQAKRIIAELEAELKNANRTTDPGKIETIEARDIIRAKRDRMKIDLARVDTRFHPEHPEKALNDIKEKAKKDKK